LVYSLVRQFVLQIHSSDNFDEPSEDEVIRSLNLFVAATEPIEQLERKRQATKTQWNNSSYTRSVIVYDTDLFR